MAATTSSPPPLTPYDVGGNGPEATASRPTIGTGFVTFDDPVGLVESECTLGFFARYPNRQIVVFTAGHCADAAKSDPLDTSIIARYLDPAGDSVPFGEYIKAVHSPTWYGQDIAMIQVAKPSVQPVAQAVGAVTGYSTADDLEDSRPTICVLGGKTGLHCGAFGGLVGIRVTWTGIPAVEGDSGGPVYARWPDGTYTAVGVVDGVQTTQRGMGTGVGYGTLIADDIKASDLTLLGTR